MKRLFLLFISVSIVWADLHAQDRPITLANIWATYDFYPLSPSGFRWMNDDNYFTVLEQEKGIVRNHIINESDTLILVDFASLDLPLEASQISSYTFSDNEKTILLKADVERIYRHSRKQKCITLDLESGEIRLIHEGEKVINPTLSRDGSKLAYVFENNIYYSDLTNGETTQVTTDGKDTEIINGLSDWVYEEEFAFADAFKWSPDGKYIAFYRFDEAHVKLWTMAQYGYLYPVQNQFKYPKAGEENAFVSIHAFELAENRTMMFDIGEEKDQYIPRIKWVNDADLAIMRMNRLQNKVEVLKGNPATGETKVILTEQTDTYIKEPMDQTWHFLANGDMLWLSERSGYNHIYLVAAEGGEAEAITEGEWEIDEVVGIDQENELIYYTSSETSPLERQFYKIGINGKGKKKLSKTKGHHHVTASSAFNYFVDTYSNTTLPNTTALKDAKGKVIRVLEKNETLQSNFDRHGLAEPEFFSFSYVPSYRGVDDQEVSLNGFMIKPADFDENKEYPVLMSVYGGPGSQRVMNKWGHGRPFDYMWYQMLAQKGYIVACVDNRGTGGRGKDFRASTYPNLGRLETLDQIAAAEYLGSLSYVNPERIGIWGWSYGGYMTALCLTKGNDVFKTGISVAPVTNWRFYDTIYTERYLQRPQDNPRGYDENSPLNFADQLKGNLLLVHGTGDDNVHFQNTVEFVNALIAYNKQFDVFFYPNRSHGISGGITRYHLYNKMTDYILENL